MPLTTNGLIEEMQRFRRDKLALVALIGCMGAESERDALERIRNIRTIVDADLTELRRKGRGKTTNAERLRRNISEGVRDLIDEVEPWLTQVVQRT